MRNKTRKRQVSSCVSCYTRKQKCDRRYPCNHCTRRRRPEECVYNSLPTAPPADEVWPQGLQDSQATRQDFASQDSSAVSRRPSLPERPEVGANGRQLALLPSFGYFEDSDFNTAALLRTLLPNEANASDGEVPPSVIEKIQRNLHAQMPSRHVLDFLIQHFVSELNWMKQLVHAPSFLPCYQQWWDKQGLLAVADLEFAALILRICSYAAQFLPSPSCAIDVIGGLSLYDIRDTCSTLGDDLARTCVSLDWKGSLIRVQHILFRAMDHSCQGRTDKLWEGIGCASQAAQKVGIHRNVVDSNNGVGNMEREIERRVFCGLYVLDSHMARQLDRVPFLPDNLIESQLPRMHLAPDIGNMALKDNAPEMFTERLMQLSLNRFWRGFGVKRSTKYDPTQGEDRYERFCSEYLSTLPPAFALKPDTQWDKYLPKLAMQRQVLRICIFDSICWNFRPLLHLPRHHISTLAPYKQVLLQSQKKTMAMAALQELEAISVLHAMFNGAHTRFAIVIFNTFEAAVLLLCLCSEAHADVLGDDGQSNADSDGSDAGQAFRERLLLAAEEARGRLQMLADVSEMAASGVRVINQLFTNIARSTELSSGWHSTVFPSSASSLAVPPSSLFGDDSDLGNWMMETHSDPNLITELFSTVTQEDLYSSLGWPEMQFGLPEISSELPVMHSDPPQSLET